VLAVVVGAILIAVVGVAFKAEIFRLLIPSKILELHEVESPMFGFHLFVLLIQTVLWVFCLLFLYRYKKPISSSCKTAITLSIALSIIFYVSLVDDGFSSAHHGLNISGEDGALEWMTAALFFLAGVLLILSKSDHSSTQVSVLKYFLGGILIIFAMEEISWGQRIFHWVTPAAIARYNVQGETNVHNFFNQAFYSLYPIFNFSVALFLVNLGTISQRLKKTGSALYGLLPARDYELFGPVFMAVGAQSLTFQTELSEQIFAVFVFFYALTLFRSKGTDIS